MIDDRVYINKSGVPSVLEEEDDWEMVDGGAEEHHDGRDQQRKDGAKDRLWPLSLLREVHSRRFVYLRLCFSEFSYFE